LANARNYRTIGTRPHLSDIGLRKSYRLPTSGNKIEKRQGTKRAETHRSTVGSDRNREEAVGQKEQVSKNRVPTEMHKLRIKKRDEKMAVKAKRRRDNNEKQQNEKLESKSHRGKRNSRGQMSFKEQEEQLDAINPVRAVRREEHKREAKRQEEKTGKHHGKGMY
jgi:hypothetical protein